MPDFGIDWQSAFAPSVRWGELILRGSLTYLVIFSLMRFVLKREGGNIGLADLLLTVLVADAAQNAMSAEYKSVTDGFVLVGTLVFWNYTLDWLTFHCAPVRRILEPPPLKLVENGRMLIRNMRKELISEAELMRQVRQSGVDDLAQVERAVMEADGQISVIKRR